MFQTAVPELRLWIRLACSCEQGGVIRRFESSPVPDLGLSGVDLDPTVMPQFDPQQIVDVTNPLQL